MDIAKLKAFIIVAEELNFRRSAEILGMSQPPLTRLISSLEFELGVKLFERTTRKVTLTGAGVLLLKEAREITSALERIETEIKATRKPKTGVIRIGFSRTVFMARFPTLIEEFQIRFPKIKLELQEESTNAILRRVKEKHFDVGFVESITSDPELTSHQVDDEILGVLLPAKHPLASRKEIDFSELKDETIILHHKKEAEEFHARVSHLIQGMAKKPKTYIKAEGESCPILVATGKGVSLTIAAAEAVTRGRTKFVPIKEMFLPVSAFWKSENQNPALKSFLSFVIEKRAVLPNRDECLVLEDLKL